MSHTPHLSQLGHRGRAGGFVFGPVYLLQELLGAYDYSNPDEEVNGKEIIKTTLVAYSISILN